MLALVAFDLWFLAQRTLPEIGTYGLVAALARLAALEAFGVDVATALEEVEEECDLL